MKEIKKDKVFQYTGMYIPVEKGTPRYLPRETCAV